VSKKNQNLIKKSADALEGIREELETLNNILYGLYVEVAELNSKVGSLEELMRTVAANPLRVIVDTESLLATVKKAEESVKPKAAEAKPITFEA